MNVFMNLYNRCFAQFNLQKLLPPMQSIKPLIHANDAPQPDNSNHSAKNNNTPTPSPNEPPDLETVWRELIKKINAIFSKKKPPYSSLRTQSTALTPPKVHPSKQHTIQSTLTQSTQLSLIHLKENPASSIVSLTSNFSKLSGLNVSKLGKKFWILISLIWLSTGFYTVPEGQMAIITQWGEPIESHGTGLGWHIPYPIQTDTVIDVMGIRQINLGNKSFSKNTTLNEKNKYNLMLTLDENLLNIPFQVQYRLKDKSALAYAFAYMNQNTLSHTPINRRADHLIALLADTAMREEISKHTMDNIFNKDRNLIVKAVHTRLQKQLDAYTVPSNTRLNAPYVDTGIQITHVAIQAIKPPESLQSVFDDVIQASQNKARIINDNQILANQTVLKAKETSKQLLLEAKHYKESIIHAAQSDIARFKPIQAQYVKYPELTRQRLYLDSLQHIFQSANKVLFDSKTGNPVINLPVDKLIAPVSPVPASSTVSSISIPPNESTNNESVNQTLIKNTANTSTVSNSNKEESSAIDTLKANRERDEKIFR